MSNFEEMNPIIESKKLVMKPYEFGDYIGYCPWCNNIFYLKPWPSKINYMNNLIYQCSECGKWVQLF
mgnify:CR=1 FL=1